MTNLFPAECSLLTRLIHFHSVNLCAFFLSSFPSLQPLVLYKPMGCGRPHKVKAPDSAETQTQRSLRVGLLEKENNLPAQTALLGCVLW